MFIRGGVASGTLVQDERIVVGSAIIRAHELKSKIVSVPRVIVDDDVVSSARQIPVPVQGRDAGTLIVQEFLARDDDGHWILDAFAKDPTLGGNRPAAGK
jgi:hypothetical protein